MAARSLSFQGGEVTVHVPTVDELRQKAAEWIASSALSFAEGDSHAADGDLDTAITQLQTVVRHVENAVTNLKVARELEKATR